MPSAIYFTKLAKMIFRARSKNEEIFLNGYSLKNKCKNGLQTQIVAIIMRRL